AAVRGSLWGRPVSVDVAQTSAMGVVGTTPFQLSVHRDGGALRAVGNVQHKPTDFTLTRDRFSGAVASCDYDLRKTGDLTYGGTGPCSGRGVPISVRIPDELSRWGDVGSATALALLLSES